MEKTELESNDVNVFFPPSTGLTRFCAAPMRSHSRVWAEMQLAAAGPAATCCILPSRSKQRATVSHKVRLFQELTVGQPASINLSSPV